MKKALALAALGLSVMSSNALAGEHRRGDAALGALSGAVVFGPVGALAGALVGFTAGPRIAQSWGLRGTSTARRARRSARQETSAAATASQPSQREQASSPPAGQPQPPSPATASTPPVQTLE
jgi:predicted lipid-binding transport protein (Tim44 family)